MINELSNNKPSGFQSYECDAGTPISGRTSSSGSYQILKVNSDGSINNATADTQALYTGYNTTSIATIGVAPPNLTFIGKSNSISISDGQYQINPTFIYTGGAGGGISFILYKSFTNLDTYINTLTPFTDTFQATAGDVATGLYGYWHNTASQGFSTSLQTSFNRTNTQSLYLTTGQYYIAIITDGATVFNAGVGLIGFYEFLKIA
jgi:hypothetical protein